MTRQSAAGSLLRCASLIALGAISVHQLRYLIAYGSTAGEALADQGHGYLNEALPPLLGFALAGCAAGLLRAAMRSRPGTAAASPVGRAVVYAMAVFGAFSIQESVEGAIAAGHAAGLAAPFAAGGWLALPLSLLIGAACAAADRGLVRLEVIVAALGGRPPPLRRPPGHVGAATRAAARRLTCRPLAFGFGRRPPPILPV